MDKKIVEGRILCIDWGRKNIGLAISDPVGLIAKPLRVLKHISREENAKHILRIATENGVILIIIGIAYLDDGTPSYSGRSALRLSNVLKKHGELPVKAWDESGSTRLARKAKIEAGTSRRKRRGHLDATAAAIILQDYLDREGQE